MFRGNDTSKAINQTLTQVETKVDQFVQCYLQIDCEGYSAVTNVSAL